MTREEELSLIERVKAGDRDAFEPLVLEHQTKVYSMALRITGNEADAWDAAQDAFLRAYKGLKDFRGESRFSTWLYKLTGSAAVDLLRRRKDGSLVPLYNGEGEADFDIPDERFQPETELEKKELRENVQQALALLPEDYRRILTLRELGGLSYEELGDTLGLETGTVKSRLSRARQRLCALLSRDGNFSAPAASKKEKGGVKRGM